MREVERNVMCALLGVLKNKNMISEKIYEKAEEQILGTLDLPACFAYSEDDRKEVSYGST